MESEDLNPQNDHKSFSVLNSDRNFQQLTTLFLSKNLAVPQTSPNTHSTAKSLTLFIIYYLEFRPAVFVFIFSSM